MNKPVDSISINYYRLTFLFWQFVHCFLLFTFSNSETSGTILFLSGLANVFLYGYLLFFEWKFSKAQVHPIFFLVASGLLRFGICSIWASWVHMEGLALRLGPVDVSMHLMRGQLILTAGDWLIIFGFTIASAVLPNDRDRIAIPPSPDLAGWAIGVFAIGWLFKALFLVGLPLNGIGNIFLTFVTYSSPTAIYLLYVHGQHYRIHAKHDFALVIIMLVGEGVLALSSFMKHNMLTLVVALFLCLAFTTLKYRNDGMQLLNFRRVFAGVAILIFVVFILFPYSQLRRQQIVESESKDRNVAVWPLISDTFSSSIPGSSEFRKLHEFPDHGAWSFLSRQSDVSAASWSYKYVNENGHCNGEFIVDGLVNLIPRVAWPDKPAFGPGGKISVMLGYGNTVESAGTSAHCGGIAAGLFLNFGFWGMFFGCLLNGLVLCLICEIVSLDIHQNAACGFVFVATAYMMATHIEGTIDGGITQYAYILLVFLPLTRLMTLLPASPQS